VDAPVHTSIDGAIARITLNRPDKRNALDRATLAALTTTLQRCERDNAVRVIELRAAGEVFCAGADLGEMQSQRDASEAANLADAARLATLLGLLDGVGKPTLARVQGDGYGGALGLMAACDVVVAASHARFAFTEVRLGIIPAVISPFVLAKIGASAARRYFLTAERLDAARLRELGLIHEVVAGAELDAACARLTRALLEAAPGALAEAKRLIRDVTAAAAGRGPVERAATAAEMGKRLASLRVQPEAREGFAAFFEKRKPQWAAKPQD
jgi:methylglutaconyl-CoA hydratase